MNQRHHDQQQHQNQYFDDWAAPAPLPNGPPNGSGITMMGPPLLQPQWGVQPQHAVEAQWNGQPQQPQWGVHQNPNVHQQQSQYENFIWASQPNSQVPVLVPPPPPIPPPPVPQPSIWQAIQQQAVPQQLQQLATLPPPRRNRWQPPSSSSLATSNPAPLPPPPPPPPLPPLPQQIPPPSSFPNGHMAAAKNPLPPSPPPKKKSSKNKRGDRRGKRQRSPSRTRNRNKKSKKQEYNYDYYQRQPDDDEEELYPEQLLQSAQAKVAESVVRRNSQKSRLVGSTLSTPGYDSMDCSVSDEEGEKKEKEPKPSKQELILQMKERLRVAEEKKGKERLRAAKEKQEAKPSKQELILQMKERLKAAKEKQNALLLKKKQLNEKGEEEEAPLEDSTVDQSSLTLALHKSRLEEAQARKKKALKKKLHTMKLRHAAAAAKQQQQQSEQQEYSNNYVQEETEELPELTALQELDVLLLTNIGESGPENMVRFPTFFEPLDLEADADDISVGTPPPEEFVMEEDTRMAENTTWAPEATQMLDQFADAESDEEESVTAEPPAKPPIVAAVPTPVPTKTPAPMAFGGQFDDPDEEDICADTPFATSASEDAVVEKGKEIEEEGTKEIETPELEDDGKDDSKESAPDDNSTTKDSDEVQEENVPKLFPPGEQIDHLKIVGILKRKMELRRKKIELKEKLQRLEQANKNSQVLQEEEEDVDRTISQSQSEDMEADDGPNAIVIPLCMSKMNKEQLEERRVQAQQKMDITQTKHLLSKQSYLLSEQQKKVENNVQEIQECQDLIVRKRQELKEETERIDDLQVRSSVLDELLQEKAQLLMAKRRQLHKLLGGDKRRRSSLLFHESLTFETSDHQDDTERSDYQEMPFRDDGRMEAEAQQQEHGEVEEQLFGETDRKDGSGGIDENDMQSVDEIDNAEDDAVEANGGEKDDAPKESYSVRGNSNSDEKARGGNGDKENEKVMLVVDTDHAEEEKEAEGEKGDVPPSVIESGHGDEKEFDSARDNQQHQKDDEGKRDDKETEGTSDEQEIDSAGKTLPMEE